MVVLARIDTRIRYTSDEDTDSGNAEDVPTAASPTAAVVATPTPKRSYCIPVMDDFSTPTRAWPTPMRTPAQSTSRTPARTPAQLRTAFVRQREHLTVQYYTEFNDRAFGGLLPPAGKPGEVGAHVVPITWSKTLNTTAGTTRLVRANGVHSAEIALSTKVVDDDVRLRNTLCHEMCHAIAFLQDKITKPPHGGVFKKWAAQAMAAFPQLSIATCHSYQINFKFKWECQTCQKEYGRHSNSIDTAKQRCGMCTGELKLKPRLRADGTPAKVIPHTSLLRLLPTALDIHLVR